MTQGKNEERLLKKSRAEEGSVTVLIIAFLPVLLLLLGLSIDIGRILAAKTELYKACDIAARETARRIDVVEASVTGNQRRGVTTEQVTAFVEENLNSDRGVRIESVDMVSTDTHVTVTCKASLPLLFSGLINRHASTITVTGMARIKPYVARN